MQFEYPTPFHPSQTASSPKVENPPYQFETSTLPVNVSRNRSAQINEMALALSKAQSEIHSAEKDSTNTFFKNSKYASLASVWDVAREPLSKNGLCVIQTTEFFEGRLFLITILAHSSGQWIQGEYLLNPTKEDPQGLGAAMTYARRYALSAIVGITQADDDAESAIDRTKASSPSPRPSPYVEKSSNELLPRPTHAGKMYATKEEALEAAKAKGPR